MYIVLSTHLVVDDVTYDEVRCYRLLEVQLSRGTFKISVIVPDRVSSLDIIHPFCEIINIPLSHCECLAILYTVMLVGVSNTLYLIIIISRFIYISSYVMCQCLHPLILVRSCFRRMPASITVEVRYLLYTSQFPLVAVQGRKPKQRHFSGIMRHDSIRTCVAHFLEVIIRLSSQTSRWRQHCDMLRNARAMLSYCSCNDVMVI